MTTFSNIHSNNNFQTALISFKRGFKPLCLVNIQQTSEQNADPLEQDLRCENEGYWLGQMQNALFTIQAFSHSWFMGSAPNTKTSSVAFIVTLYFVYFN